MDLLKKSFQNFFVFLFSLSKISKKQKKIFSNRTDFLQDAETAQNKTIFSHKYEFDIYFKVFNVRALSIVYFGFKMVKI